MKKICLVLALCLLTTVMPNSHGVSFDENISEIYSLDINSMNSMPDRHSSFMNEVVPMTVNPTQKPYVKNKRFSHTSYGSPFFTVESQPGSTMSISKSKSYSVTVSNNYGVSNSIISAGVGVTIGSTETVTGSSSVPVPKVHNGKKVKLGKMDIRAKFSHYKVDVYKWNNTRHSYYKAGTAEVKVPTGVNIRHWFVYM